MNLTPGSVADALRPAHHSLQEIGVIPGSIEVEDGVMVVKVKVKMQPSGKEATVPLPREFPIRLVPQAVYNALYVLAGKA